MKKGPEIRRRLLLGESYSVIRRALKVSSATISYHARKLGLAKKPRIKIDWSAVQKLVDSGLSVRSCRTVVRFSHSASSKAIARGALVLPKNAINMSLAELLAKRSGRRMPSNERRYVRRLLVDGKIHPDGCAMCKLDRWLGKRLMVELDHIDGDPTNNTLNNLRLLCPNCHSTTETWRGRNHKRRKELRVAPV